MNSPQIFPSPPPSQLNSGLLASIGLGLVTLHLLLTWRFIGNVDQLLLNVFFWLAIVLLIWRKRGVLPLQSTRFSSALGSLLMGLLLGKATSLLPTESEFIRFFPGLACLALALLASGWKVHLYFRELAIALVLMLPPGLVGWGIQMAIGRQIQLLIAQSAAFIMHFLGTNLMVQGTEIILRTGAVRVEYACTGISLWILLMQLSCLIVLSFNLRLGEASKLLFLATSLAWLLASIRVSIMTALITQPRHFDYWHGPAGGQIFSTIAILLFALGIQRLSRVSEFLSSSAD